MKIEIPELSLVVLVGASGSGKSTFAQGHFRPTEIISSDACRAMVADDESDQSATGDAFELLHFIAATRLKRGKLAVIDATNVQPEARKPLLALAKEYHCLAAAIVFNLPESICQGRNEQRGERSLPPRSIHSQVESLRRSLPGLKREGFRYIYTLASPEEVEAAAVERRPLWTNRRNDHGPFDLIGDVHGCCDELEQLLERLGYLRETAPAQSWTPYPWRYRHPQSRKVIFLGDIVDRGPRILEAYGLVRNMVEAGEALCVPGNHDDKLLRKLKGRDVVVKHGLEQSLAELKALPEDIRPVVEREMADFIDRQVSHYVLDDGKLVAAHAGMKESMAGRASSRVRDFALYGETSGETDEFGLPVRYPWANDYRGEGMVVYGHTPVPEAEWLNRTINVDTGCVFGGRLTALRYPELELVSVPAGRVYSEPARPIQPEGRAGLSAQKQQDELLDIEDVLGKRIIDTRLIPKITIREGNSAAALEVMSRFLIDPKWLIYLPPTMSPPETSHEPGLLEHPQQAFDYYRKHGVKKLICEEKHMGSRLVLVICRDEGTTLRRFGIAGQGIGMLYTRTGRRFFEDRLMETNLLAQVHAALTAGDFWEQFNTGWFCLDCELMPWSLKAQELIKGQYAAVGAASQAALAEALADLQQAAANGAPVEALRARFEDRAALAAAYTQAYRRYCWPVRSLEDIRLSPFHILATEGAVHTGQTHLWHMQTAVRLAEASPNSVLQPTGWIQVDVEEAESAAQGLCWWQELTGRGGEGMVVKPLDYVTYHRNRLIQPAIKCRGGEYLRIIYGAEYTLDEHLSRLRQRSLNLKRTLALREFALGIEALERFVNGEPLRRVHECVFGVLAMESEPVDPRL